MLAEASCIRRGIAAACGSRLSVGGSGESCPVEGLVLTVAACIDSMQAFSVALHECFVVVGDCRAENLKHADLRFARQCW